ncbi:hypothetical protein D5H78_09920 [Vallicoccus soli]|uniref:Regulator component n=1 Tax=Vallicoccus soli TaxID=2339232 RepID=A0A3A3YWC9_9ACTN|nr:hypothetical protein D5H78_09920 [Vallicoccus soli]
MRRRCERLLDALELPADADLEQLVQRLAEVRGRRLVLQARPMLDGPCGIWVAMPEADYVFYEEQTNALHREHIVLHELGHVAADHAPPGRIPVDVALALMPSLDPALVRRMLGRTSYSSEEEREAELFASVFRERRSVALPAGKTSQSDVVHRVGATLRGRELP